MSGQGTQKILNVPLPQILDELESYIKKVEDAVTLAREAAADARKAAGDARSAGENAASDAKRAVEASVARVVAELGDSILDDSRKIDELSSKVRTLIENARKEAAAIDVAILAAKERHVQESPYLQK
jgi:hypothetical protein